MPERKVDFFFYQPPVFGRRKARKPKWTTVFITTCIIVFIFDSLFPVWPVFAFTPDMVLQRPWTIITSIFFHAGLDHLFFNMFALYIFGMYLEPRIPEKSFLNIFFAAGILGNVAYYLASPVSTIPAVGASGAIYGVMGMLAVLYPGLVVYLFGVAPMPMIFAAGMWFVMEFTGMFVPSNIAHEAHLAGLIAGTLYGLYARKNRNKLVFFWEK